jgi:hypothetical protein
MERVMSLLSFCVFTVRIIFGTVFVYGQIGVSYCACQPSVYTFTFNFSAFCDIATIHGPGVLDDDCFERGIGLGSENTNDTVPILITSVSVSELNKNLAVFEQTSYIQNFRDGDSFSYTSILSTPDNINGLTPDTVPGGLQLDLVGINQLEQPITNVWQILFDTVCGIFPILEVGDQIGWTILVSTISLNFSINLSAHRCYLIALISTTDQSDLQEPLQAVCPLAAPPPTNSPTSTPTKMPYRSAETSLSPSDAPSLTPSRLCLPDGGSNPGDITDKHSSHPVQAARAQKGSKRPKTMGQRKTSEDNTALFSNQYLLHQRQKVHQFYRAPNLDGRGVGTRTPVATPVECPDSELRLTEKMPKDLESRKGSKSDVQLDYKMSKADQSRHQKKDPISVSKRNPKGDLRSNEKSPQTDDDVSFIVLTRSPSSPQLAGLLHILKSDPDFGT